MVKYDEIYAIAKKEMGIAEIPGKAQQKRILEYHACTSLKAKQEEVPWCASFANWVLKQSGLEGTNSAAARSFMKWGKEIKRPVKGCIVVFTRKGGGHVAFFHSDAGEHVLVLGGNQSDKVSISSYPKARLLGYRGI